MIQDKVFQMMNAAKERIIKTMQERGIKKVNLVMTQEEWAKENDFAPDANPRIYENDYNDYRNQEAPYVIFFNKWGNGMDYSAYSVELVDGPVNPRFKLECYNSEEGSEWFYDSDLTSLSMIGVYDAMEKELGLEEQPKQEVWVLFAEGLCDYELMGRYIVVYKDEEEARKAFKQYADESRKTADDNDWVIGNDSADFFEAYPDGSWGTSHETVELNKTVLNEKASCHL